MSLRIRMSRIGAKKHPYYRIVVADSRQPRDGRFLEKIGYFDPMRPKDSPERSNINQERAQYWLSVGAKPSDRVEKILAEMGLVAAPKRSEQTKQHLPKAKAQRRTREAAESASEASKSDNTKIDSKEAAS
ncbi:MAG: 30S ribosomal protein S16 [Alphaproteobacteria bacterium]|nr:30S ribosomal protein S16 [Alphaproteobacteria bacterium]